MASSFVKATNAKVLTELDFSDRQDFDDSNHGFICSVDSGVIMNNFGFKAFNVHDTDFLEKACPDTVNPSLWRQCQLTRIHGLFELIPGKLYQFRGFDIANMSFIKGDKGWIVIDTLCSIEAAAVGLKLLREKVANLPVTATILTHSHGDHIRGMEGVLEENTLLVVPKDLFKMNFSEELLGGIAMGRRSCYQFGNYLEKSEKGWVGCGLGTIASYGTPSTFQKFDAKNLIEICEDKTLAIDGITVDFMYTPNAEAPTEMMMYFPQLKAVCTAEEINRTQHNLYTLRGAVVRNGKDWAKYIDNILAKYSDNLEVSFGSHDWPTFGNKRIVEYYEKQRDMYKYIHDQTLRQANLGTTIHELPEKVILPHSLSSVFYNRGYYGTVQHNCKGQYQYYLGFYDGNPANLNPLSPVKLSEKYVESMGGEEKCIEIAKGAFESGEYQWAITLLNHVVFKNPRNFEARKFLAEVYRQNAFMQESAVWRNIYLTGAKELDDFKYIQKQDEQKNETINEQISNEGNEIASTQLLMKLPFNHLFDFLGVCMEPISVENVCAIINFNFIDTQETGSVLLKNSVLNNREKMDKSPTLSVKCTKVDLVKLVVHKLTKDEFLKTKETVVEGIKEDLFTFISALKVPFPDFPIIEP
ncbi:alkyl/aryl-sulfatase BDS1, putative [Entamoeba invadens IP1]|uniref:Alkyl/aryl-sulfatase BDS1, putative n=1 Tax=Entamoeba invadens IP1 TaxID=370355 RepID=A0A0A1TY68_ENTIV|nr:alkyl/aryl-sulfatase BDS1, putative [Entamoeba invadens IP1]ELP83451.1 alkyl/aryl-sulfatase BDS1, putative [Entamoeba invadens IP1]|eukprot:XP_004182797.1 alkyl/aryl-sulfatase BDS1, putative [Entamoeba invadens IP1]